ncbi:MAG: T9SS type A sorting domain-containing protein [Bacteroidota bacterium]
MRIILLLTSFLTFLNLSAATIFVTQNGAGSQDGSSWANAISGTNLQTAINNAQVNDEVWVACGTYLPTSTSDRTQSFSMRNGISIYGGFVGVETSLTERNLTCSSCSILSGDLGTQNVLFDNSYHVIFNQNLDESALIDGFQIVNGYDDRATTGNEGLGGGIYNGGSLSGGFCNPTILNCVFRNNHAGFGGGIFDNGFSGGNASPHIENCYFEDNTAFNGGGAIDNFGLDGNASPTVINCVFINNIAPTAGGIYCWGGGTGTSTPSFLNCTFYGNQATNGNAGAIICDNSDWGGTNFDGNCQITVRNSIFWGNTAILDGPQFFIKGTATFNATYSCVDTLGQTNANPILGANTGNIFLDPSFVNPVLVDNCLFDLQDAFMLNLNSPCLNSGDNTNVSSTDIAGNTRILGNVVDMGAYERLEPINLVKKISLSDFEVYPNPTRDELSFSKQLEEFTITNCLGQEILKGKGNSLSTENFQNGVYYLKRENSVVKFVVKH